VVGHIFSASSLFSQFLQTIFSLGGNQDLIDQFVFLITDISWDFES